MISSRFSPALRNTLTYFFCSGFKGDSQSKSAIPRMAFMGVRISWLMLARNSLFASLEASAATLSCCNTSARLRSVMSRAATIIPAGLPSRSVNRAALSKTSTRRLSLVNRWLSIVTRSPCRVRLTATPVCSASWDGTKSSRLPSNSSRDQPNVSSKAGFI